MIASLTESEYQTQISLIQTPDNVELSPKSLIEPASGKLNVSRSLLGQAVQVHLDFLAISA